jgi:hypothetical protein
MHFEGRRCTGNPQSAERSCEQAGNDASRRSQSGKHVCG